MTRFSRKKELREQLAATVALCKANQDHSPKPQSIGRRTHRSLNDHTDGQFQPKSSLCLY